MSITPKALRIFCCFLLCAACLCAQSTDAVVSGTITDPSGASVAGASVTALNLETGVVVKTVTNESGVYRFPPLPPGKYEFAAEQTGFRKAVTQNVIIEAAAKLTLNSVLQLGATSESIEVQASVADITASTATVSGTVEGRRLQDLPITGRDAMNFLYTQAGMGSVGAGFNGTRSGALNVTTDGIATLSNRIDGINTTGIVTTSGQLGTTAFQGAARVDRVEEVRIVTSPADVEYGRGMGQLQLVTRAGTNGFHGSLFEEHRDTVLNANNWFGNAAGTNAITHLPLQPRQILVSNQYGGRIGGPIKRNKTFFNFYYEGQQQVQKNNVVATVLSAQARQGMFRFFPGAPNSNAGAAVPTVTVTGDPLQPAAATGPLQTASIFGLDPNRLAPDATGVLAQNIKNMPFPNYFLVGDGLNTAGYAWQQRVGTHFDTYEGRIDHNFSENERLQLSYNHVGFNTDLPGLLPTSPAGKAPMSSMLGTIALNSVFRPNLLNELRIGIYRPQVRVISGYDPSTGGPSALYHKGDSAYLISPLTFTPVVPIDPALDGYANVTPNYQYGDNITWVKGRHSFKGGFEARLTSYAGYDIANVVPRVYFGAGTTPVTGLTTTGVPGIGQNLGTAQGLLLDLTGSVGSVTQTLNAPSGSSSFLPGLTRYALIKQHEFSWYFKDDIKIAPNFTLNLGLRYELYQVPYEGHGNLIAPAGGGYSLFGISGNSYAAEFQPGVLNGQLITPQQIGPNGPHPNQSLFKGDHNNFGPGIGFAWSLPWLGKDKTVFRAGYGVAYERTAIYVTQLQSIYAPGLGQTFTNTPAVNTNLQSVIVPVTPTNAPLQQIPLNSNPFASRQLTFSTFDPNLRTPYIQNWSASLSRVLAHNAGTVEVRYVGTKGTKLVRGTNVNETNIFENGIANAFNIVRAGGDSPLINQIFGRYAPAGQTGSQFVLTSTATQSFFANNNAGAFANFINNAATFTPGVPGGLLVNAGLPENFVTVSPQYATEFLLGNNGGSTYHALQVEYSKRFSAGYSLQSNLTFNRYLGDYNAGDDSGLVVSFRTLRNKNIDKALLDRKFFWRTNGLWELPFGPGKWLGRNTHGVVAKLIGGWQVGSILNVFSGFPISFVMSNSTFNTVASNALANLSGSVPSGSIQKAGTGVQFFGNYKLTTDPQVATLAPNIRPLSGLRAVVDASGNIVLSNALPGTMGNMAPGMGFGPGYFQFDMNVLKKVKLTERAELQLGANATNVLNHPQFAAPNTTIDSTSFGRITSTVIPNRVVVLTGRITF